MKRILLIAACAILCLLAAPRARAAEGYLVQIPDDGLITAQALAGDLYKACDGVWLVENARDLAALRSAGLVIYAEPNFDLTVEANSWNVEAVHAPDAWAHTDARGNFDRRGTDVTIAVIDSGVEADNADFKAENILPYRDYGNNKDGLDIWHGTFVAGIIAAQLDNGVGIDGVAPDVKILPVTITSDGVSDAFTAIRAIEYAAARADIINLSIGGGADSMFLERTCRNAVRDGVILVAAAGNFKSGETPTDGKFAYPAGYDCVVSVTGCKNSADGPVFDSLYSYYNNMVDVSAPGSSIRSLYMGGSTAVASGTSFAAPTVTAMAAMAKQANPAIDTDIFLSLLDETCIDLGTPGRDDYYGRGFVDIRAFLEKLDEAYAIHYYSGEEPAQFAEEVPETYTIADGEITLPEPVREGWRFAGWYESPDLSGRPVTKIPTAATGERSFYARWEALPNDPPTVTDAPADADVSPASLDGLTEAVGFTAGLNGWFSDPEGQPLRFELVSGPGAIEGSVYTFVPTAQDAEQAYPVTVRAVDDHDQSVEHTFTLRVGPLPSSRPVLEAEDVDLNLSALPPEVSAGVRLYENQIVSIRLGETPLAWRVEEDRVYVAVPALTEGEYEITVEFNTGDPAVWRWTVHRDYPLLEVRPDAPTDADVSPASLDGLTEAIGFTADLNGWFSDPEGQPLRFELVSGPGAIEGSVYSFVPTAQDAERAYPVTVRAVDGHGQSVEHTCTLRVGPLPSSRPVLEAEDVNLNLSALPSEVSAGVRLYENHIVSIRLGETALAWRAEEDRVYVAVPALIEGEYEITVEFSAGDPALWHWTVHRDYPLLEVRPDAPTDADVSPASLDGVTSATPYHAEVHYWFTVTDIDYALISGPGTLVGDIYDYRPEAGDAGKDYAVTVRASDSHGQSAEHTVTLHVGPLPASHSVLHAEPLELPLSSLPEEVSAPVTLYDNRVTAVRIGNVGIPWRFADNILYVTVPDLPEGDYTVTVEFTAGIPADWRWTVYRDYPLLELRDGAPANGTAAPASLDGLTNAIPFTADIADWFTVTGIDYALISGPGSLDGSEYAFVPEAADAGKEYAVTLRATDSHGQSVEHTVTLRVADLPFSQPVLNAEAAELPLSTLPAEAGAAVSLYGNRVAAVRLGEEALAWRLDGETLYVAVPALAEGGYEIAVEFDAGEPAIWRWNVYRDYPLLEVRSGAPDSGSAAPASLDGGTGAVPFTADVADWFTVTGIDYALISGTGTLTGPEYAFLPETSDAEKEYDLTIRATDLYGQTAEHTLTIHVDALPPSQSLLTGEFAMNLCDPVPEAEAELTLYGNRVTAVRLGDADLDWRLEGETLTAAVPDLPEGDYEITVEFDAGEPAIWSWRVYRDCPSAPFRDISVDAWYHTAVDFAVRGGLMNGVGGDRFAPESSFTRAMLVTVLHRAAGSPEAEAPAPFADVAAGSWYAEAVAWAAESGIVNGVAPDRFAPDAPITREQLVTILFRYAGDDGTRAGLDAFPDADAVSDYAREAMAWAIGRGLVNGIASGDSVTLSPRSGATRAQVAAILMRFLS